MKKLVGKIVSNSIFLMISSLSATLFSFLFWLIIGKLLLPEDYGVISTTINLAVFLSVVTVFGFGFTLIKLLPEYLSKGQNQKSNSLIAFSFKFMLFSGILMAFLLLLFSEIAVELLNIPHKAVLMASGFMVFITLATYFDSVLRGFQNMKWVAIMQIFGQFSKLLIAFALIILGFGYLGPLFGFLSLYLVTSVIGLGLVGIKIKSPNLNSKGVLIKYAFPAFVSTILSYVFFSGRFIILNAMKSSSATGIFGLATTMTAPLILLPNVLLQAIFPVSSELTTNPKYKITMAKTISYFLRYILLITAPMATILALFSKPLILTFSRPEYLGSVSLFPILAAASIVFSLGSIFYQTLYALKQTRSYKNIMLFSIIIFLSASIPLTYIFSELGMAFSVLIFSIFYSALSYLNIRKLIKISIPILSLTKIIVSTIISMAILYLLDQINSGLIWGIISITVSTLIYVASLMIIKFVEKTDVNLLKNLVLRIPFLKKNASYLINFLYRIT